jgi:hypothetical protein
MDEQNFSPEKEIETVADAIIDSFIDEDIKQISKEDLAKAIEVGASTLVGIETDDDTSEIINKDGTSANNKSKKKKLKGSFFLGLVSVIFALLCIICCCTPFAFPIALPIQLIFLTLAIIFLLLDKKYNGKSSFSVSAIVGIIFSICIVVFTLIWVGIMLVFGLIVKPAIEENVLPPIIETLSPIINPFMEIIN